MIGRKITIRYLGKTKEDCIHYLLAIQAYCNCLAGAFITEEIRAILPGVETIVISGGDDSKAEPLHRHGL
jgi:hypothetical protein